MTPSQVDLVCELVQVTNSMYGNDIFKCQKQIFMGAAYGVLISFEDYIRHGDALRSLLNLLATIGGDAAGTCVDIYNKHTYRVF